MTRALGLLLRAELVLELGVHRIDVARGLADRRDAQAELVEAIAELARRRHGHDLVAQEARRVVEEIHLTARVRDARRELVDAVVREQGVARYSAYQILRMIIERSDQLRLYPRGSRRDAQRSVRWVLARLVRLYADSTSPQLRL